MGESVPLTAAQESTRRVRAAIGFSLLERDPLADKAGIDRGRLKRLAGIARPTAARAEEREALAIAADVPLSFLEAGFTPDRSLDQVAERVDALADALAALQAAVAAMPDPAALALALQQAAQLPAADSSTSGTRSGRPGDPGTEAGGAQ